MSEYYVSLGAIIIFTLLAVGVITILIKLLIKYVNKEPKKKKK